MVPENKNGMNIHCVKVEVHMKNIGRKQLVGASMKDGVVRCRGFLDDFNYLLNQEKPYDEYK
jgi:hypothetical protein